ncbi:hypothetical protein [Paenibacillus sp. FSL L8-0708]|uniref:hypothetical protein n=1 Tax=Paenibacillus sp. FSL L8-0708 TaxID=2975311 RepID=UPI0030FAD60A
MDWLSKKTWRKEDELYSPKRKVNNKGSRNFPHIIGSIPSRKMERHIPYESLWGECLFYYLLELDPLTVRYYPQPVWVPYQVMNSRFELEKKGHVPDTLVFRQGNPPHLYQIKGGDIFVEQQPHLYSACMNYCIKEGWGYSVVRPKLLPETVKRNIQLIMHYKQQREYYNIYIHEIMKKVAYFKDPTIEYLAKSFIAKVNVRDIIPLIYHLIFLGELKVDLLQPLDLFSKVSNGNLSQYLLPYFNMEGDIL